jgi:ferredoxin
MGEIIKVVINRDGCLLHGCCRDICPEVFGWPSKDQKAPKGEGAYVKEGAERFFVSHEPRIRDACVACPVGVISVEEK